MAEYFRDLWDKLDISYDGFIRTTEEHHKHAARLLLQKCYDAGDIYKGTYAGWYCLPCEAFYADDDLVEGKCPVHDAGPEWTEEENYFFALSKYEDKLLALYEEHPESVLPDFRRNEVVNMVRGGLRDFSISRANKTWGIPVPFDEEQVIYVWFDALTNYITGVGFGHDDDMFARYWPGGRARRREGHHPFSLRVLAGNVDVRRSVTPQDRLGAWLDHVSRREDEQVTWRGCRPL